MEIKICFIFHMNKNTIISRKNLKKNIKTISRKKEAIFNYTLIIAIFNAP